MCYIFYDNLVLSTVNTKVCDFIPKRISAGPEGKPTKILIFLLEGSIELDMTTKQFVLN